MLAPSSKCTSGASKMIGSTQYAKDQTTHNIGDELLAYACRIIRKHIVSEGFNECVESFEGNGQVTNRFFENHQSPVVRNMRTFLHRSGHEGMAAEKRIDRQ